MPTYSCGDSDTVVNIFKERSALTGTADLHGQKHRPIQLRSMFTATMKTASTRLDAAAVGRWQVYQTQATLRLGSTMLDEPEDTP